MLSDQKPIPELKGFTRTGELISVANTLAEAFC